MADHKTRPLSRMKPATLFSAVAIGAVTASVGIAAPAAFADQNYPSWDDVQKAKQNQATKSAEVEKITALLTGLQTAASAASKASQIAAEGYRITLDQLNAATVRESSLTGQAAAAKKRAETSKMRAGLIASHFAKAGAQDLSLNLFLNGNSADDLLHQLGTATKLGEQSDTVYRQAVQDKNTAESLAGQAASAKAERERLSALSMAKYDDANSAAQGAQAALDTEQKKSAELYEQLALLKDTTAEAEREYHAGLTAAAAARALAAAQAAAPQAGPPAPAVPAAPRPVQPAQPGQPQPVQPAQPAPAPPSGGSAPAPAPAPEPAPAPAAAPAPVAPPNASAVDIALSFARAQLGDRYQLGGSGPDAWDCSGLTKAAYASAGVYIGTHSATDQYNTMRKQGRLVPFSQAQAGDLVFWGSPGNYYHVALYVGGGRILEAPDYGKPVRIHSIWSPGDVAPYVGRPTG